MSTTWKQVVLDVADAWREANDSTAKIPVGELPNKVKEGGENIDPELTTLESTLQEILEILPFKGAMAEGKYAWKKSEYAGFSVETTGTQPITLKLASELGDLSKVDISFFTDWVFKLPGTASLKINGDGTCDYTNVANTTAYSCAYNQNTQTLTINNNITSSVKWELYSYSVKYVVVIGNDENAYPNGGIQDGYWYELLEEIIEPINYGTVTLSAKSPSILVNHRLKKVPSAAYLIDVRGISNTASSSYANLNGNVYYKNSSNALTINSGDYLDMNIDTVTFKSSSQNYGVGTYHWLAI